MTDLEKAIAHRLKYFAQVRKRLDAHHTKAESIALRKQWLDAQKRANYQNEYDRIRGILSKSVLPPGSKRLQEREAELENLGVVKGVSLGLP